MSIQVRRGSFLIRLIRVSLGPITTINSKQYWSRFGYLAPSSVSCPSTRKLATCLTTSSYYLNSYSYCYKYRDTITINCDMDTSKLILVPLTMHIPSIGGCTYKQIRLYNGSETQAGMVQICNYAGRWTAVCDFSWGCNEATAACRHLGYANTSEFYCMKQ